MAELLDARDPGFRLVNAFGSVAICAVIALSGARLPAAAEVEVDLDVLKSVPAAKPGAPAEAIELIPPKAQHRNVGRREDALRRARQRQLIEEAKRKAAARKRAEAARKAAAKKKAEDARKSEEAKQAVEMERRAKAARAAEKARRAAAEKPQAEAAKKKAEAVKAAEAAKAAQAAKATKAAEAAKVRETKAASVAPKAAAKAPVKAAAVEAKKAKTSPAAGKQVATRTVPAPLGRARLLFEKESAALNSDAKGKLEPIAAKMISQEKALLVIYAYAASDGSNTSDARRLSLSRALAVREIILKRGIPATRTQIRALGERAGTGPADRVDLVLVER